MHTFIISNWVLMCQAPRGRRWMTALTVLPFILITLCTQGAEGPSVQGSTSQSFFELIPSYLLLNSIFCIPLLGNKHEYVWDYIRKETTTENAFFRLHPQSHPHPRISPPEDLIVCKEVCLHTPCQSPLSISQLKRQWIVRCGPDPK